ncbi:MAG: hypothetical protein IJN48_02360 [Clostridia bacterium]|nr:hypothetical protein [Clostridia bacterium]
MEQKRRKSYPVFKVIKAAIKFFYPKMEVIGTENLPDEPVIIVGNHTQLNGPIACELYSPRHRYTWCAGEMMHLKDVPAYAYKDFWSQKSKITRPFYKVLAYAIAPLSVIIFNNANTIGVYRDARILSTFRATIDKLNEGADIVIFPEHDVKYNNIVYEFQEKFIDIAKLYYKRSGKELTFVPLYIAPKLKKMYLGKPVRFCAANPIEEERARIRNYLMAEITSIAVSLPEHTVVPYRNIPKRYYPKNTPEVKANEKTDS